jgi:hypothetical protein
MPYRSVLRSALLLFLACGLAACAPKLTRFQEITWDAFKACQVQGPSTLLERVSPDGRWLVVGREGEVFKVSNCMQNHWQDVRQAGKVMPASELTDAAAKELVRFAYY